MRGDWQSQCGGQCRSGEKFDVHSGYSICFAELTKPFQPQDVPKEAV
jgi:hypothetical protein